MQEPLTMGEKSNTRLGLQRSPCLVEHRQGLPVAHTIGITSGAMDSGFSGLRETATVPLQRRPDTCRGARVGPLLPFWTQTTRASRFTIHMATRDCSIVNSW